jgi:predicted ATPase
VGDSRFITRVILKNYRSIGYCDVELKPLTYLVGPNGSGKSNFLDALRLVSDSLNTTLDHALRDRNGIKEVRRRSTGHPRNLKIKLHFQDRMGGSGFYEFEISAQPKGGFEVRSEECQFNAFFQKSAHYRVERGQVISSSISSQPPAASSDRLYLVNVSGLPEFRKIYESLSHMGFYNLNPEIIRELQAPDTGEILQRDGHNIASVVRQLEQHIAIKRRIEEFLSKVVPSVEGVEFKIVGPKETLEFKQQVLGSKDPWRFLAANMSDGTLRALGVLIALFQSRKDLDSKIPLVGIEEPEAALHPAAAGVLREALNEASMNTQIIVTSHSPDLLDHPDISDDSILAVSSEKGTTRIAKIDEAGRSAIKEKLVTAGELLRLGQLVPDEGMVNFTDDET